MPRKKTVKLRKKELTISIMQLFESEPKRIFTSRQISNIFGFTQQSYKTLVSECLAELTLLENLLETSSGKYKFNNRGLYVNGKYKRSRQGKNYVITQDSKEPIFVAERNSKNAMNGDTVKVMLCAQKALKAPEGEIVEIIKRAHSTFVGILDIQENFGFLVTDSKVIGQDIFIPKNKLKGGKDGQKAVAKIIRWPERGKNPQGEIIDILGNQGDNNTEMNAIMAEYDLPYIYPKELEEAAEKISPEITKEEEKKREDFRNTTTFTIDPKDAKDFDDALSIKKLDNDLWEVGVHIADVTHYVKPGDIIDREAQERATSVYLVDRTIPMLPERLCNDMCSLRPNEEKYCYSCIFNIDNNAKVKNHRIVRSIIKSDKRFAYEDAQKVIEDKQGELAEEILTLNDLAKKLRKKRFEHGSVNFERVEVKFNLDDKGKPIGVYFKESKEANKLIEEFMLLANRTVAEEIGKGKNKKPFVYRVHDLPDPEKLDSLSKFITKFGYDIKINQGNKNSVSKALNTLLDNVKGKAEENLIETVAIRAMAKAIYTTENVGHYGLAFDYYTHFTSPIRRYPDMMVHRLLDRYLSGGKNVSLEDLEDKCKHCSDMEQTAAKAERSSIKYKQVEFMSDKLGEEFDGVISGITEWGLYVEVNDNKCEGMIPIRDLDDDYYEFDEKNFCLRGKRNHKVYQLGDPMRIMVARASLEKRQLDFSLVKEDKK